MTGKLTRFCAVLTLALTVSSVAQAGPFLGEWSCFWRPARYCPKGCYSPAHYWIPECYVLRSCFCPSNLDQYPPGPSPSPPLRIERICYPCQTLPPMPSSPYADPTAYYGRPLIPVNLGGGPKY